MRIAFNLSRKVHLGITLGLLLLMAIGVVSYLSAVQFAASAEVVSRSHRIISALQATLADIVSAESETRGFVITGDETYLTLYRSAIGEVDGDIKELRLLATDPGVRERLIDLERLTRSRLARLKLTVETRRIEGLGAVLQDVSGKGKKLMDELREVAYDIEKTQQKLLTEHDRHAQALSRRTIAVVTTGSIFAVVLAVIGIFVLATDIAHRERFEKEVLEISEREQRRIGQDLHDGVCQHLTGISLFSRSLQQKLADKSAVEAAEAARITELINESIEQTRRVTRGLHPVPNEPTGLVLALRELAENVKSRARLECHFDCPGMIPVPDQAVATNLYRIAQEAVQNVLRHAHARKVVIALNIKDDAIQLRVSDDGRGMPEQRTGNGMGMEIMSYRASTIGATLEARSGESGGTVVTCTLSPSSLG